YANLSRAAMRRLIPELESGTQYATARQSLFPESFLSTEPVDELPSVAEAFDDPVSPAVSRALSAREVIRLEALEKAKHGSRATGLNAN
ncbi:MAG: hypothetical protein ACLFU2_10260, partial [Opitutales bacterium]